MSETNCASICASVKVTDCLNATDPATLTASPQRVFKSRCFFCSSTNGCADHLPTAASTAVRTLKIAQTADLKPPTTAPTKPSRTSSICSPPREGATSLLESSSLTSLRLESKALYRVSDHREVRFINADSIASASVMRPDRPDGIATPKKTTPGSIRLGDVPGLEPTDR